MTEIFWDEGIPNQPVTLEEFCAHWRIGPDKARQLIADGTLPAARKTPGKRGSPYLILPNQVREYARNLNKPSTTK